MSKIEIFLNIVRFGDLSVLFFGHLSDWHKTSISGFDEGSDIQYVSITIFGILFKFLIDMLVSYEQFSYKFHKTWSQLIEMVFSKLKPEYFSLTSSVFANFNCFGPHSSENICRMIISICAIVLKIKILFKGLHFAYYSPTSLSPHPFLLSNHLRLRLLHPHPPRNHKNFSKQYVTHGKI